MTKTYRTSVAGTLLDRGKATRESVLNALPGTCREVADKTGLGKSTVKNAIQQLLRLEVIALTDKRVVKKNVEFIYSPLAKRIPSPAARKVLKTFTDPQKFLSTLDNQMREHALTRRSTRNLWTQPVYEPPKWTPPRGEQPRIPSRGK